MHAARFRGRLLVASPALGDPNFDRTVVLMLEHTEDGAVGVVLNRPSPLTVAEAIPDWEELVAPPGVVHIGGPVDPSAVIALARSRAAFDGERETVVGRIVTVDLGRDPALATDIDAIRVFAGYAGWAPGQLEAEYAQNAWIVVDAEEDDVLHPQPEGLWRTVLRRQPGRLSWLANFPPDPSLN